MNKYIFALFVLIVSGVSLQAQNTVQRISNSSYTNESSYFPRNEIRANLLMSVIGLLTFDYEYFVEDNFGVGLTGSISMLEKGDWDLRGLILPYGRLYFSRDPNAGFFIEGNTGLVFYSDDTPLFDNYGNYDGISNEETDVDFGIGVGTGYKLLTRNNWIGELQLGIGRVFGKSDFAFYPRVGISIGKRF